MFTLSYLILASAPLLVAGNPITARAGGPGFVPVAAKCTVYDVLTGAKYSGGDYNNTVPNAVKYEPKASVINHNFIYSYYVSQDTAIPSSMFKGCLEQCNYFPDCKSALVGRNVTIPKGYYGADGKGKGLACLALNKTLTVADFKTSTDNTWIEGRSGVILCP